MTIVLGELTTVSMAVRTKSLDMTTWPREWKIALRARAIWQWEKITPSRGITTASAVLRTESREFPIV